MRAAEILEALRAPVRPVGALAALRARRGARPGRRAGEPAAAPRPRPPRGSTRATSWPGWLGDPSWPRALRRLLTKDRLARRPAARRPHGGEGLSMSSCSRARARRSRRPPRLRRPHRLESPDRVPRPVPRRAGRAGSRPGQRLLPLRGRADARARGPDAGGDRRAPRRPSRAIPGPRRSGSSSPSGWPARTSPPRPSPPPRRRWSSSPRTPPRT